MKIINESPFETMSDEELAQQEKELVAKIQARKTDNPVIQGEVIQKDTVPNTPEGQSNSSAV